MSLNIAKLTDFVEQIESGRRPLNKAMLTVHEIDVIRYCLMERTALGTKSTETISEKVANIFKEYGATVSPNGVGWKIEY